MKREEFIISVESLKEGENKFKFKIPKEMLEIKKFLIMKWIKYEAVLLKKGSKVILKGKVETEIILECSRCLEKFKKPIDERFEITYIKGEPSPSIEPIELSKFELDEDYYQKEIDILSPARDAILLSVPIAPVCKPNCKGLCPVCGKNLNKERCNCKIEISESPFSVLKKMMNK